MTRSPRAHTFRCFALVLCATVLLGGCAGSEPSGGEKAAPTPEETTLTQIGQEAPDFSAATLNGDTFSLAQQRGRVVLVNWFATWCPPCIEEMPHLQRDVWERFTGPDFAMVSVAREEKADVVAPFIRKHGVTWPFALDPERTAFARYAEAFIPRNVVIDRDGTILFQSHGFERPEFDAMIQVIAEALARP